MKPQSQIPDGYLKEMQTLLQSTPFGATVELGVYKGGSAFALFEADPKRPLHLFDTFNGMPKDGDGWPQGCFNDTSVEAVKAFLPDAHYHVGFFPKTMPSDLKELSFVHIDCDQGDTCAFAIALFYPLLLSGGVMAWDDYGFPQIKSAIHSYFGEPVNQTELGIPWVRKP